MNLFEKLNNRAVIIIRGEDRENFLQSLTTNDVIKNEYSYNLMLSPQGRYLFDFFVYNNKNENYFLIDIGKNSKEKFLTKLKLYKLRAKVEISDETDFYEVIYSTKQLKWSLSFQDNRNKNLGFRTYFYQNSEENEKLLSEYIFKNNLYLDHKYENQVIDGDIDLEFEKSLPPEYGFDYQNAISYDKGCYVGQEVISRAKYQGVVRKKIYMIKNLGKNFEKNTEIVKNGEKIGKILSSYEDKSLALIKLNDENQFQLSVKIDDIKYDCQIAKWYE